MVDFGKAAKCRHCGKQHTHSAGYMRCEIRGLEAKLQAAQDEIKRLKFFDKTKLADEMQERARKAEYELQAAQEREGWISVDERLPRYGEAVLIAYQSAYGPKVKEAARFCRDQSAYSDWWWDLPYPKKCQDMPTLPEKVFYWGRKPEPPKVLQHHEEGQHDSGVGE